MYCTYASIASITAEKQNRKKYYLDCFLLQRLFNCTDATQSVPIWCTLYNEVNSILHSKNSFLCVRVTATFSIFFVLASQTLSCIFVLLHLTFYHFCYYSICCHFTIFAITVIAIIYCMFVANHFSVFPTMLILTVS